ncbi:RagB/SusD family nutrient uptake outer membrane protein [Sphingobacterium sp. SG20118]|uniref:RagB/SusD family nutrient uptake outer membrane protein n=1 Tax=Sphingobacterium sp. SG20118 TaxID=3367156 RepID=UPI0037DFC1E8
MVRNYSAEELVKYFHSKKQEDYGNAKIRNISTKDRFFPIPYDEYKLNPEKMYQNPGY